MQKRTDSTAEEQRLWAKHFGFSLRALLVGVAVIAIVTCLALSLVERHEHSVIEEEIVAGLRMASWGLRNYAEVAGGSVAPPLFLDKNGSPLFSWRLRVISCVISLPVTPDWKVRWNAPSNRQLADFPCWAYCSSYAPSDRALETRIFALSGKGTAFDPSDTISASSVGNEVILLMEVADSGVRWMEPGDYDITKLMKCTGKLRACVRGNNDDRVHVLFADGEIWCLSGDTPMERLTPFFLLDKAPLHSRQDELGAYRLDKWDGVGLPRHRQMEATSSRRRGIAEPTAP